MKEGNFIMKFKKPVERHPIDIHFNPDKPGTSRIPVDTSIEEVEKFLKSEIVASKQCACPCCDYRRHMFRKMQEIIREYKKEGKR